MTIQFCLQECMHQTIPSQDKLPANQWGMKEVSGL